jgi:hypothetical protein
MKTKADTGPDMRQSKEQPVVFSGLLTQEDYEESEKVCEEISQWANTYFRRSYLPARPKTDSD